MAHLTVRATTPLRERKDREYGREPDDLKIMPVFCPVVGRTRVAAQAESTNACS